MYEEFYGLKQKAFSKTPDPKFLYLSKHHEEALARLHYAVEEKELIVLTGEVGSGKTTLTRSLMDSLGEKYRVVLIINPRLTPLQFLRTIAKRFEINVYSNSKDNLLDTIYEKVYSDYESGITPVIIIDEAQLIPHRNTFEEIRLLTNFQLDSTNLLSVILVGQSDLRKRLNHKVYLPLRQRIGLFYHLRALERDEIKGYIDHRLRIAGAERPIFTEEALQEIYHCSGGIPRLINSLATSALLDGFGKEIPLIDESLIHSAARELGLNGYREN